MTIKQLENRFLSLEQSFINLATRTGDRDNDAESSISTVKAEVDTTSSNISDAWNDTKLYVVGDYAIDNNTMYEALFNSKGLKPSENPTYWKPRPIAEVLTELINKVNNL